MTSVRTDESVFLNSLVSQGAAIEEVIRHMDAESALVVDDSGVLVGMLTDGDIRRALLKGADLHTPVSKVMTKHPMTVAEGVSKEEIVGMMLARKIRHLPVVDASGRPVGLELLKNQYDASQIAQAVLMAGGKGMRLRPLTEDTPKPLLKLGDQTILDNVLNGLKSSGVGDVVISVNYLGDKIKDHVSSNRRDGLNIDFVEESKALGTAGALSLLNPRPRGSFIVMNADLITQIDFKALQRFHAKEGNKFSVCVRKVKETVPYGVVSLSSDARTVSCIEEKPEREYLVNAGIYMLEPEIVDLIPENCYFDMPSLIRKALDAGHKVGAFPIYEYWRDIGRHNEMQAAKSDIDSGIACSQSVRMPAAQHQEGGAL